jgi:hypothetical protein
MRKLAAAIFACALALGGAAAGQSPSGLKTTRIGTPYKDPVQRAADHFGRGIRAKRKAEAQTDPAARSRLYEKARKELAKSVELDPSYDAALALGQVYLALDRKREAYIFCSEALSIRPGDEAAKGCVDQAQAAQDQPPGS